MYVQPGNTPSDPGTESPWRMAMLQELAQGNIGR